MTLPRVWLLGVLAALFKRRDRMVLLRVLDRRGAWLLEVEGVTLHELRLGLDTILHRYAGSRIPVLDHPANVSE